MSAVQGLLSIEVNVRTVGTFSTVRMSVKWGSTVSSLYAFKNARNGNQPYVKM